MRKISGCILIVFFCFSFQMVRAQSKVSVKGTAIDYIGEEVRVYYIQDYLSKRKQQIAYTKVGADSTFSVEFSANTTRKVNIQIGVNHFYIYIQPGGEYKILVGEKPHYLGTQAEGTYVDYIFQSLDTNDINFKIISFNEERYKFMEHIKNLETKDSTSFAKELAKFKYRLTKKYQSDTSKFLKTHIKFSIAFLDELPYSGHGNAYQKYTFYIKSEPVSYHNDTYMRYINFFYDLYEFQLVSKAHTGFSMGIYKESPSIIMNALANDFALKKVRLRELIMIKMLSQAFYTENYNKMNIVHILDSLSSYALFKENKKIAKNICFRLLELRPGTFMPDFSLTINGKQKSKNDYEGNHVYIQFIRKNNWRSIDDLKLIYKLQQKYSKYIDFITILVTDEDDALIKNPSPFIQQHKIAWDFAVINKNDSIIDELQVTKYPYYLLMDATGHVVAAPALTPRPDGEYETIEKTLFLIQKHYERMNERR